MEASPELPSRGAARVPTILWALAVAAVAALPPVTILASGKTMVWRDTSRLFEPMRTLVVAGLRELRLPQWNPHEALGMPLFAQMMHSVLHPVTVLGAFIAPVAGMDPFILVYVVIAALGTFVLARTLGVSPVGSAISGIVYGLSGYVLGMSAVITYQVAASTAPWTVLATAATGRGRRFALPMASLAIAFQIFAGDPQWLVVAAGLGLVLGWSGGGIRGLARCLLALALGALAGAVQLAPAWEYVTQADRGIGLAAADLHQWDLAPARILELIAPGLFAGRPGAIVNPVFHWLGGTSLYTMPFAPSIHVGVVALVLALAGVRSSRQSRILTAAAVILLWMALGANLGAEPIFRMVPVWKSFRYAEKMVGPFTLCVAVLAGFGADRLVPTRRAALKAGAMAALLWLSAGVSATRLGEAFFRAVAPPDAAAAAGDRFSVALAYAGVGAALLAGAVAWASTGPGRGRFRPAAAAAVTVSSLLAAPFALYSGARIERATDVLEAIRETGDPARIATPVPVTVGPDGLDEWGRPSWAEARLGHPAYNVAARVDQVEAYTGILPVRYLVLVGAVRERFQWTAWRAYRRFALTHVVLQSTFDPEKQAQAQAAIENGRKIIEDPRWDVAVWAVPHRPWAFFAEGVVPAPHDGKEAARLVASLEADGRTEVVLGGGSASGLSAGSVIRHERGADRTRIEAESPRPGLLVVNDAWWPGWTASIDGVATPVLIADAMVRAVPWPGGRHTLDMSYETPGLALGARLSALAFAAIGLIALGSAFRVMRRREARGT